jgi:hypothetical protein
LHNFGKGQIVVPVIGDEMNQHVVTSPVRSVEFIFPQIYFRLPSVDYLPWRRAVRLRLKLHGV